MKRTVHLRKATRIEGNADIHVEIQDGKVLSARFLVHDFRGIEKLVSGRRVEFVPSMVSRVCGICSASHQVAGLRAVEDAVGARVPPSVEALREAILLGEWIGSHALSYFFLTMPDVAEVGEGIVGLMRSRPEIASDALALRKAGLRIVEILGGRAVHPVSLGVARFLAAPGAGQLEEVRGLAREVERLAVRLVFKVAELGLRLDPIPFPREQQVNFLAAGGSGSGVRLRAFGRDGKALLDFPAGEMDRHLSVMRADWTFATFPYLSAFGFPGGITLVGPLARLFLPGSPIEDESIAALPLAAGLRDPAALGLEKYDTCRLLEIVWAARRIGGLLEDIDLADMEGEADLKRSGRGVCVLEAPRGLLVHSYLVNRGCIESMRLLVATQFNNPFMNLMIGEIAAANVSGDRITPEGEKRIGRCLRIFDPCLSCATH